MAVKPVPDGFHTVTPYLVVTDARKFLDFARRAFDADLVELHEYPDGTVMHGQLRIGDSMLMFGEGNEQWKATTTGLNLYVPDSDALYRRALAAGGQSLMEPMTHYYGDRSSGVVDPCGNFWWLSTHVEDVAPEELKRRHEAEMKRRASRPSA